MIYHGDCLEVLKSLPDNSIDSCVTDPPYGLSREPDIREVLTKWMNGEDYTHRGGGFMGKTWDSFVPGPSIWREVYRVLKPGAHLLCFAGTRTQDLMTISLRLAGFEIRDVIEWLYFCLSEDTECLTRDGWKRYDELTENDEVMQWNHETNELSWTKPSAIHVFDYHGDMLRFKSRATDQLVTPNHRMYVKIKRHSRKSYAENYEVIQAKGLKGHWGKKFPVAGEYSGTVSIGLNRARLLGWWLTDAWKHGDGKACMFSQSKPDTLKKLKDVLDACDVHYSEYVKPSKSDAHNPEHVFYVTGNDAEWLLTEYPDRKLPRSLVELVKEERRALLESLIDGDGSRDGDLLVFWSKDAERLEAVRLLMMSLNMRTSIDLKKGCVRGSLKFNTAELQAKHKIERVKYDGKVWCLTVPTGAFVVRRNHHIFITGNSGFPKSLDVGKAFDKRAGAEREVIAQTKVSGGLGTFRLHGFSTLEELKEAAERGEKCPDGRDARLTYKRTMERLEKMGAITAPATPLARKWDGWGTALKPAHEPIILARKPLDGTVADNVERWGTGALNIDGCRIPHDGDKLGGGSCSGSVKFTNDGWNRPWMDDPRKLALKIQRTKTQVAKSEALGRFPANCVTTEPGAFYSKYFNVTPPELSKKASKRDRNSDWQGREIGLDVRPTYGVEKAYGLDRFNTKNRNNHPTVKPTDLMAWLVRLVTPPGGTVLDPFAGSGSTLVAAKREGFDFIGIEREKEYVEIAKARTGAEVVEVKDEKFA